jgi:hypothetical protein
MRGSPGVDIVPDQDADWCACNRVRSIRVANSSGGLPPLSVSPHRVPASNLGFGIDIMGLWFV